LSLLRISSDVADLTPVFPRVCPGNAFLLVIRTRWALPFRYSSPWRASLFSVHPQVFLLVANLDKAFSFCFMMLFLPSPFHLAWYRLPFFLTPFPPVVSGLYFGGHLLCHTFARFFLAHGLLSPALHFFFPPAGAFLSFNVAPMAEAPPPRTQRPPGSLFFFWVSPSPLFPLACTLFPASPGTPLFLGLSEMVFSWAFWTPLCPRSSRARGRFPFFRHRRTFLNRPAVCFFDPPLPPP